MFYHFIMLVYRNCGQQFPQSTQIVPSDARRLAQ